MEEGELVKKYNLDLEKLKQEQIKLGKTLELKDAVDFSTIERIGAIETIIIRDKIIAGVIVCDKNFEILEQQYSLEKLKFPYIHEFRSYRELPSMINAFEKLQVRPDVVLISGHGITHKRLGIASHFSLFMGVPTIGVTESLFEGNKIKDKEIFNELKLIGKILQSKEGSNPLFISPGNKISINSAFNLCKSLIKHPHKMPEPLHLAHRYARSVKKELGL